MSDQYRCETCGHQAVRSKPYKGCLADARPENRYCGGRLVRVEADAPEPPKYEHLTDGQIIERLQSAIHDCYTMARRRLSAARRGNPLLTKDVEAWQAVLRFCEQVGCAPNILRDWPGGLPEEVAVTSQPRTDAPSAGPTCLVCGQPMTWTATAPVVGATNEWRCLACVNLGSVAAAPASPAATGPETPESAHYMQVIPIEEWPDGNLLRILDWHRENCRPETTDQYEKVKAEIARRFKRLAAAEATLRQIAEMKLPDDGFGHHSDCECRACGWLTFTRSLQRLATAHREPS